MIRTHISRRSGLRFVVRASLALGSICVLAACSGLPPVKEQTRLQMRVETSSRTNVDEKGRAAPVMVRVYELKSASAFENADFFSLQSDAKSVLGEDALVTDEFILRPGSTQDIRRRAHPNAVAIGVLVGYRDLGKAVWRTVYRLPPAPDAGWYRALIPAQKIKLNIDVGQLAVSITETE
jgi:type VI secretion system protein VasD